MQVIKILALVYLQSVLLGDIWLVNAQPVVHTTSPGWVQVATNGNDIVLSDLLTDPKVDSVVGVQIWVHPDLVPNGIPNFELDTEGSWLLEGQVPTQTLTWNATTQGYDLRLMLPAGQFRSGHGHLLRIIFHETEDGTLPDHEGKIRSGGLVIMDDLII